MKNAIKILFGGAGFLCITTVAVYFEVWTVACFFGGAFLMCLAVGCALLNARLIAER